MKTTIRQIVAAVALTLAGSATAQHLTSSYFLEGSVFRNELNPALGNEQNYVSMPALGNINVGMHGNFGLQDVLFNRNGQTVTYLHPDVTTAEALSGLNDNNKLLSDIRFQLLGGGFRAFGGYNTVAINTRVFFGAQLPYDLFAMTKELQNQNYSVNGVNVQAQAYAELALGHSRQIGENWRVGGKLKFLFGAGRVNAELDELNLNLAGENQWTADAHAKVEASVKGLQFKQKTEEYNSYTNASGTPKTYTTIDDAEVDGGGLGGFGMAVDLGAEYDFKELVPGLKASLALVDLGFINWSNNMLVENNGQTFKFDGFHNTGWEKSNPNHNTLANQTDELADKLTDLYRLQDKGDQGSVSTGIGSTLNVGVSYTLPMYDKVTFGLLSTTRFQGDYSWNEERLSANYNPCKWFGMNVNGGIGTYGPSFGWMLNLHPTGFNFFVGMDHMLGKTSKEFIPLNSNASFAMGINIVW